MVFEKILRGLLVPGVVILLVGSCTSSRTIFKNLANQDDYEHFPNVPIAAADEPFEFPHALEKAEIYVDEIFGKKRRSIVLDDFLGERKNLAFLVIRNDTIIFERYAGGYESSSMLTSFSISKSMVSAMVGIAIAEGKINSVEDPVTAYLPQLASKDGFDQIKIKHLLNHTSGIRFHESYINPFKSDVAKYYYGKNLDRIIKKLKLEEPPETSFHYHSANTQLLGMALASATDMSLSQYFQEKIWTRIGTSQKALWSTYEKQPVEKAFCCINATAHDFAKFGKLMAQKGHWNGEQIIPEGWVNQSIRLSREEGSIWGYQNQWVMGLKEYGDFMAQGLYDQYIYVMPKKGIIIVSFNAAHIPRTNWVGRFRQIVDQL